MSFLVPDYMVDKVYHISESFLRQIGVKALILDVDNTLTTHGNPEPAEGIHEWIREMDRSGIRLILVSNNSRERVFPFAQRLGLPFISMAAKPLTLGYTKAARALGLPAREVGVVGDQIFTDIAGGNLKGMRTILVTPFLLEDGRGFRLKRRLERRPIQKYHRRQRYRDGNGKG